MMKMADGKGHLLVPPRGGGGGHAKQGETTALLGKDWHPPPPVPRRPGKPALPENKAILVQSPPPLPPRPVSSFLIALKFIIGSQSLDGSPVSDSQARYQSGKPRVISSTSSTFMEQEALSHDELEYRSKSVSDEDDWNKGSKVIGLEAAFKLPEWRGPREKKINMRPSLGSFSEQEKRSQRNSISHRLHGRHTGGVRRVLLWNLNWNPKVHTPGSISSAQVSCVWFVVYEGTRKKKDQGGGPAISWCSRKLPHQINSLLKLEV